jgi:hypothetical protein
MNIWPTGQANNLNALAASINVLRTSEHEPLVKGRKLSRRLWKFLNRQQQNAMLLP